MVYSQALPLRPAQHLNFAPGTSPPARARRLGKRLSRIDPPDGPWSVHRTLLPVACNKDLGSSVIAARSILNNALNFCRSAIAPFTGGSGHLRTLTAQFQFG